MFRFSSPRNFQSRVQARPGFRLLEHETNITDWSVIVRRPMGILLSEERRISDRWRVEVPCRMAWNGERIDSLMMDISYTGAKVRTYSTIPGDGESVRLEVPISRPHRTAMLRARVVHAPPKNGTSDILGLQFQGFEPEVRFCVSPIYRCYVATR